MSIKTYIESILLTAIQMQYPSVQRLTYKQYGPPVLRRWDALYIDDCTAGTITLDVTDMSIGEICRTVADRLRIQAARPPIAATNLGSGVCPKCRQLVTDRAPHCVWCGQTIDWRN